MKTFDRVAWASLAVLALAGLAAVTCFNWEPPTKLINVCSFAALAYVARARYILTDIER